MSVIVTDEASLTSGLLAKPRKILFEAVHYGQGDDFGGVVAVQFENSFANRIQAALVRFDEQQNFERPLDAALPAIDAAYRWK